MFCEGFDIDSGLICVQCMKNEDKLNIFHLFNCIEMLTLKKVRSFKEMKQIEKEYYKLKKQGKDIKEITHIIISEFEKRAC